MSLSFSFAACARLSYLCVRASVDGVEESPVRGAGREVGARGRDSPAGIDDVAADGDEVGVAGGDDGAELDGFIAQAGLVEEIAVDDDVGGPLGAECNGGVVGDLDVVAGDEERAVVGAEGERATGCPAGRRGS